LLPSVITEIEKGGILEENIRIVMATAAHRPQTRIDLEKKLGEPIIDTFEVLNHNPNDNLVSLGYSSRGTPIEVNRDVMEADLKVSIGSIIPHDNMGFGGGSKTVLPGICGMRTIEHNHDRIPSERIRGEILGNNLRADANEVARKVGLNFIVNTVVNARREIAGIFAGDMIEAYEIGVKFAKKVYATAVPQCLDMAIVNAYPTDTDLIMAEKAIVAGLQSTRNDGTIVLIAACREGLGYHLLQERKQGLRRLGQDWESKTHLEQSAYWGNRKLMILSPNLNSRELRKCLFLSTNTQLFKSWDELLETVQSNCENGVRTGIFPSSLIYRS
jgi:nickel-dependent lactate racemase